MTHQPGWFVRSVALLTVLCFFTTACTSRQVLRSDFHKPAASDGKLPIRVVVMLDEKSRAERMRYRGTGLGSIASLVLDMGAGLESAIQAELSTVFDRVDFVKTKEKSLAADFFVLASCVGSCGRLDQGSVGVGLDFRDPSSGRTVAKFERKENLPGVSAVFGVVYIFPPFYPFIPFVSSVLANRARKNVEKAFSESLKKNSIDIRRGKLMKYVQSQARAAEAEKKGDVAKSSGNKRGAFDHYTVALKEAALGSDIALRVREKYLRLAASMNSLPKVPDEAKRYMIRGQAMFKKLKDKEGYGDVVAEFEKAVQVAPWWASAYFNLALMQEKAGDSLSAMRNLKLYLVAKPHAKDAGTVNRKIIELELKAEEAEKK